jgi:alpha-amylase
MLFRRIRDNEWIKSITLSEYMEKFPAKDLVYLPTASYDKMEEWVLPTKIRRNFEDYRDKLRESEEKQDLYMFLKGGFWRYFLVKYPESNNMHKKMLYIREKLIGLENKLKSLEDKTIKDTIRKKVEEAWEEIHKAQCNDAYWHGLFGGVYLQFLRFAIYKRLINAENLIDKINQLIYPKLGSYMSVLPVDFYKKSRSELILESDTLNLYIDPAQGGTIFELDYKPKSYNLLNTLTRWEEAYHEKEKIENNEISVDRFRRSMLRFRIFQDNTSLDELAADTYAEYSNIPDLDFEVKKSEKDGENATIILEKLGEIKDITSEKTYLLDLQKKLKLRKMLSVLYFLGH